MTVEMNIGVHKIRSFVFWSFVQIGSFYSHRESERVCKNKKRIYNMAVLCTEELQTRGDK